MQSPTVTSVVTDGYPKELLNIKTKVKVGTSCDKIKSNDQNQTEKLKELAKKLGREADLKH